MNSSITPTDSQGRTPWIKPPILHPRIDDIPAALKAYRTNWAPWQAAERARKPEKFDKIPLSLRGARLSTTSAWYGFDEALAAYESLHLFESAADGLGLNVTHERTLLFVDLDGCVSADGQVASWAGEIVARSKAYAEISPSGKGLRVVLRGSIDDDWTNHEQGIEIYGGNKARFLTITGHTIDGSAADVTEAPAGFVEWLAAQYRRSKAATVEAAPVPLGLAAPADLAKLNVDAKIASFLRLGEPMSEDRSRDLYIATMHLLRLIDGEAAASTVLATLCHAPGAWKVALDHRRQDADKARAYLWKEHVLKAHAVVAEARASEPSADGFTFSEDRPSVSTSEKPPKVDRLTEYLAYLPEHKYIHRPTGALWPAASVDGHLSGQMGDDKKTRPSLHLDKYRAVHQMSWIPGAGELLTDAKVDESGVTPLPRNVIYNQYRGPSIARGNSNMAARWRDHLHALYPNDAEHIARVLAFKVQHPGVKVNHALVLGGSPGIGKDTILEPVNRAIGPWNWSEVSPAMLMAQFNGYLRAVVMRISEARDMGELNRYAFYEHTKTIIAAPPAMLSVNEKHRQPIMVPNVLLVIFTTNNEHNALFLPADDRRHFVAWSRRDKSEFSPDFWMDFWHWIDAGGDAHTAEYLRTLDLGGFNPKAPPPLTDAFWNMVDTGLADEDSELAERIEKLSNPTAITMRCVVTRSIHGVGSGAGLDSARHWPHRISRAGYSPERNPDTKNGRWWFADGGRAVFVRNDIRDTAARRRAVRELIARDTARLSAPDPIDGSDRELVLVGTT